MCSRWEIGNKAEHCFGQKVGPNIMMWFLRQFIILALKSNTVFIILPFTLNILAMFRLHKKVISLQQTNYLVSKNKNLLGNLTETILLAIITGKRV
jgi:hypothetical protein